MWPDRTAGLPGAGKVRDWRHVQGVITCLFQVSALFKDGTIGGNINIAIVGLILLEEDQVCSFFEANSFL